MSKYLSSYLIFIHLVVLAAMVKPGVFVLFKQKVVSNGESLQDTAFITERHRAIDLSTSSGSTLFFGDSLTVGLPVAEIGDNSVNFGADHETTKTLSARIGLYKSIDNSSAVVFQLGTNDVGYRRQAEILDDYSKILENLSRTKQVFTYGVFPVDERADSSLSGYNQKISSLNAKLAEMTAGYQNVDFVYIGNLLEEPSGNLADKYHIGDGVHLNYQGYRVWVDSLKSQMRQ